MTDYIIYITEPTSPGQNSAHLAMIGGVTLSLAIILVSTFTVIVVLRYCDATEYTFYLGFS